jgi:hypothetical protein
MRFKGVAVAQLAERRDVAPKVADSISASHSLESLTEAQRIDWEERAAIREEAPMSREDAERLAREDLEKWEKEENKHRQ